MSGHLIDRELLDELDGRATHALDIDVWRVAWKSQDVLAGAPGGRWATSGVQSLYTSREKNGAVAEVHAHLRRAPVFSSAEKLVYRLNIQTQRTLQLDIDALRGMGINLFEDSMSVFEKCQELGAAAYRLDIDSLVVPSIQWDCENLVVFPDQIGPDAFSVSGDPEPVNWPAWIEKHGETASRFRRKMRRK